MTLQRSVLLAGCLAAFAFPSWGNETLARDKQCVQCHKATEDFAGPSFHKIAAKWKGRKDAEAKLVATIQRGSAATGGPHWGKAKMPDSSERDLVSTAEAKQLVAWILKQ